MIGRVAGALAGRRIPWWVWLLSAKAVIIGLLVVVCGVAVIGAVGSSGAAKQSNVAASSGAVGDGTWDPSNIIADSVFYNATAMTAPQIQAFLDQQHCPGPCLANGAYAWPATTVGWCQPVAAGSGSFAVMLATISVACGINPQVSLVMVQKESQGLTRPPPDALTGFGCPDTGAGGSANCDSGSSGVWAQTWGMVQAFAHLKADPTRDNYPPGKVSQILWNVAETGCGSAPVTVADVATATLYTYTPYQPNAASLAAYPGTGDACSSYGNRNFFRMFTTYFGSTGGGKPAAAGVVNVAVNGVAVTLPDNPNVAAELRGKVITAPAAGIAKGLAAGFGYLGQNYIWGGGPFVNGVSGALGPNNGCARGGGALNSSCDPNAPKSFDCSGLTAFVIMSGGYADPGGTSGEQRNPAHAVPWAQGQPGDLVGYPGHVSLFLGVISGVPYQLEASEPGVPIHIVPITRSDRDPSLYRYWN